MWFGLIVWGLSAAGPLAPEADGPQLDEVPALRVNGTVPAPATWPALRYEQPLRLLVLTEKHNSLAAYQRIARRLRSSLDARYFDGGDARYHVNDKWIEPKDNPTEAELRAFCRQTILDTLAALGKRRQHDVVFCANVGQDKELDERLLAFARDGGIVVVTNSVYPAAGSPLAAVWPARPGPGNSWMSGGSKRTDDLGLAGVPTERLTAHTWIPIPAAAEGARTLALGEAGAMFARRVDRGAILFVPTGPLSRRWDFFSTVQLEYDHDDIWLRAWDQVLYGLVRGTEALPVVADLRLQPASGGKKHAWTLTARVVRQRETGPLAASLHIVSPSGEVVRQSDVRLDLSSGTTTVTIEVDVPDRWGPGVYAAVLSIGDAGSQKQLHQALELVSESGTVQLQVRSDAPGYRIGQPARLTVRGLRRADGAAPGTWSGDLRLGVYDFRGRLLHAETRAVTLGAEPMEAVFTWPVTDHGVRVDAFWAVAAAVQSGVEYGRARAKFYKSEPWSTRNEYQWSTWAGISCTNAATSLPGMRLMAHAGLNALGYPGRNGLSFAAERWGWRYYNEGVGMNTFSPLIEQDSDAALAEFYGSKADTQSPDLRSAAFVLASVGEEAGYQSGWGRTYYWEQPTADDKACRAFQWYLKGRYPSLAALNAAWRTNYAEWSEVKLTREFSGNPPKPEADGWAHPQQSPLGVGVSAVSFVPYADTQNFYAWYYDRIIAATKQVFRERINPVARTMASAPASWIFASRECDVAISGPGAWNESQWHALDDALDPAFALVWGHFDWSLKTENLFWGFLLQRTGHNNFWVDVPLMFNNDLTHTRASLAMRRWTERLAGHERAILDSRPAGSQVGVLPVSGVSANLTPKNMDTSLRVALMQSGFHYETADLQRLAPYKIVFAVARHGVSADEARRLDEYVTRGGTLVVAARFASQNEFGAPVATAPGMDLAQRWGLRVTKKTEPIPQYGGDSRSQFALDSVAESLRGAVLTGEDAFRETFAAEGWQVLAEYKPVAGGGAAPSGPGVPAILTRILGQGRVVYLNAIYQSHHYIQWVTPTGPERQGFYRLVEHLCSQAGAARMLRLDGDLQQALHVAIKQFTDSTGHIRYAIARTSGEVPWTQSRLEWLGPGEAVYDVLAGRVVGRKIPLNLRPGEGRWLAVLPRPLKSVQVSVGGAAIAGQPLRISVQLLDADGRAVPGKFPLELQVNHNQHVLPGLRRSASLESGGQLTLHTALSDPPGDWTLTVTEGITSLSGTAKLVVAAPGLSPAPGFGPLGWPSERSEPAALGAREFLDRLRQLTVLYQTQQSQTGWLTKQKLGAHYEFFPETRHQLLRPLSDVSWPEQAGAWQAAIAAGETFVLTGEDLNLDPASGQSIYPHHDGKQAVAVADMLREAKWSRGTRDGDTLIAQLGQGRVILCREAIDAAGHTNEDAARWQQRWLAELSRNSPQAPIPAVDELQLRQWWAGRRAAGRGPREVTWFGGNHREIQLKLSPSQTLESVFTIVLPPTGAVDTLEFQAAASPDNHLTFDLGCDGTADVELAATAKSQGVGRVGNWPAAIRDYLQARESQGGAARDDSGWRVIPVRVLGRGPGDVTLSALQVQVGSDAAR